MGRDDLYITIPSFFRCPISLDVMKSPVSLCTGVTYDRSSIQKWFDGGNNTCPATMQVLQSKDFVPNHTLQRLIQIWSVSTNTTTNRNDDAVPVSVLSEDQMKFLVRDIGTNSASKLDDLSMIASFAKESEENLEFLVKLDGFLPVLVQVLCNDKKIEITEEVVRILNLVLDRIGECQKITALISNDDCLYSLFLLLQQRRDFDSRVESVRVLGYIAEDREFKMKIAKKDGLILELVKSIGPETDPKLTEACLSCLITVSTLKHVKVKLVNLKVVQILRDLLLARGQPIPLTEKALKLLEKVAACKEGREEVCGAKGCVEALVGKVMKVSWAATENAVTVLWIVCWLVKDERAQEAVSRSNGLAKVLLLMQSNCSPAVRQMSADLLKVFRFGSKKSDCILPCYDTKTIHIMPF